MVRKIKNRAVYSMKKIFYFIVAVITLSSYSDVDKEITVEHKFSGSDLFDKLYQVVDNAQISQYYYVEIPKFICETKKGSKTVVLRIYWDADGNYDRYQLMDSSEFVKLNGKLFTTKNHKQLHKLLSGPDSILDHLEYDNLTGAEMENQYQVDAISGASVSTSNVTVVRGAAKITYDMWKIIYGEVAAKIKEISK